MGLKIDDELMLAPGFAAPPSLDYSGYHQYIEEMLPPESPVLYGLHPNAEIEFLTVTSNMLFRTLLEMQPRNAVSSEELGQCTEDKVEGRFFFPVEVYHVYRCSLILRAQLTDFTFVYTHDHTSSTPGCFPGSSAGKESSCNAGDPVLIPGLGRYPREGVDDPLQCSYSFLVAQTIKNPPGFDPWVGKIPWSRPKVPSLLTSVTTD